MKSLQEVISNEASLLTSGILLSLDAASGVLVILVWCCFSIGDASEYVLHMPGVL